MDNWLTGLAIYLIVLIITFFPTIMALFNKVKLNDGGEGFNHSNHFDDETKELLTQHYSRINGTLGYWKNKAEFYRGLHYYCLIWTIPSAVIIPVLTPWIESGNDSKLVVTIISTITAVLLAFHKGLKVEENLKAYRHGESEFYDLMRKLLDNPSSFGDDRDEQLTTYFDEVARIRRFVRNAETDNLGTLDDAKAILEKRRINKKI